MSEPEKSNLKRDELLESPRKQIYEFLKKKGWNVVLVGNMGIVKNPNNLGKYKYWFIMDFIGKGRRRRGDEREEMRRSDMR